MPPRKSQHYLGQIVNKVCDWCKSEFKTDDARDVYCSPKHYRAAKQARYRARKYAEREVVVSSVPGASYNLRVKEQIEEPVKLSAGHRTEVAYYEKAPVRSSADYELQPDLYNMPDFSSDECVHEVAGYCWRCDLG